MRRKPSTSAASPEPLFEASSLHELRRLAAVSRACDLGERAPPTVSGWGRQRVAVISTLASAWLDREIALVRPRVVVCLGATAAQALLGAHFRVTRDRGRFVPSPLAQHVLATVHPSAILRAADEAGRHAAFDQLVADLRIAAGALADPAPSSSSRAR